MTIVEFDITDNQIKIDMNDHAGDNRVCAAASVLIQTVHQFLMNEEENGNVEMLNAYVDEDLPSGKAHIKAVALSFNVIYAIKAIMLGFELLADSFPNNISFRFSFDIRRLS